MDEDVAIIRRRCVKIKFAKSHELSSALAFRVAPAVFVQLRLLQLCYRA